MIFESTAVDGAFVVRPEPRTDDRGHFARLWCSEEFGARGLVDHIVQLNAGFSHKAGTLRGMHYQLPPHAEVKLARCTRGAVFDVVIDLRRGSPTFRRWAGVTLTPDNGAMMYVPEGCAHGYITLEDNSELTYATSQTYAPASARGVRYDDPAFALDWPRAATVVSAADLGWPDFDDSAAVVLDRDLA